MNYACPNVTEEFKQILLYWVGVGVDGFRMDAVPHIWESQDFLDEPMIDGCVDPDDWNCYDHIYTFDQNETFSILGELYKTVKDKKNSV